MQTQDWYFRRLDLARRYLDTLDIGLTSSLVLFAPRRKGKTQFLLRDLTPAAEKLGYRVGYANFWQARQWPLDILVGCLTELVQPKTLGQRLEKLLKSPVSAAHLELEVAGVGAKAQAQFSEAATKAQGLLAIEAATRKALRVVRGHKILLLLDEVQFLARAQFEDFVASLRTSLDVHRDRVKVVFTGSSRAQLAAMFRNVKAPLFNFSQPTDFPDLDDEFVQFMCDRFYLAVKRRIPVAVARRAFALTQHTPGLFHEALTVLAMRPGDTDLASIVRALTARMSDASEHAQHYQALRALDQAVLEAVWRGHAVYGEAARQAMAKHLGADEVTASQVQRALQRLADAQLVFQGERGGYEIEDPGFRQWLGEQLAPKRR